MGQLFLSLELQITPSYIKEFRKLIKISLFSDEPKIFFEGKICLMANKSHIFIMFMNSSYGSQNLQVKL